jgi:PAS domain S-box-containing protein
MSTPDLLLRALDQLPAAVWTCDATGRLVYCNKRATEIWGRTPNLDDPATRFSGALRLLDAAGNELPPERSWTARCLRERSDFIDQDVVVVQPDGSRRRERVSARHIVDGDGNLAGSVSVMIDPAPDELDPTERERIRRASRHLAAIVESSDDAIIGKDLDSRITSWNAASERMFGYTAAEIIGQPVTVLMPPHLRSEEPVIIARIRRGERIEHYETVRVHKDGHKLDISLTVSPIKDDKGNIIGASKIVRDITQRKRDERILQETRAELEAAKRDLEERVRERTTSLSEAVAQLEEFSYTVSHDLRAPLRGMQIYSRALLEDYSDALAALPEAARYVERIADNANRLDRMVQDVLTFSRVARDQVKLAPIDLDALIRELIGHYPSMNPPAASVEVAPLDRVVGHLPSVTQALSNLLTNAVKFARPGVAPTVRVWTERLGGRVRVFVQDDGVGIEPVLQHRLFRMFERIHPDDGLEGSGVGLAIVKKAVERMNGTVGVFSAPGKGSTFWMDLAAADGPS